MSVVSYRYSRRIGAHSRYIGVATSARVRYKSGDAIYFRLRKPLRLSRIALQHIQYFAYLCCWFSMQHFRLGCQEGEEFAKRHGLAFLETSSKTAQNVEDVRFACVLCCVWAMDWMHASELE